MTSQNLESHLCRLAENWPVPSVVDAVMARIECVRIEPAGRRRLGRQVALVASAAALLFIVATWLLVFATPRTLQAQIQKALAKAGAAHIVISFLDGKDVRRQGEIWYSREFGFRAESPDEITFDDGERQLSWRPNADQDPVIVSRRPGGDAIRMVTESFQLEKIPADWNRTRAHEFDREFKGGACEAYVVTPPAPNAFRLVVLTDGQDRIVWLEHQRQADGKWTSGREISIEYEVPVDAGKFAANIPAGAKIVDAGGLVEELFPLEKALATSTAEGLLFAVHDVRRVDDRTYFIMSSVRGTPEYLRRNPPKRRRLNLHTTILEVASQPEAPGNGWDCNRATLATAESNGVHYLWWLAVERRYFSIENGERKFQDDLPGLETEAGRVRVPLAAIYRTSGSKWITTAVEVDLRGGPGQTPLVEIAGRVRRDVISIRQDMSAIVAMHGGLKNNTLSHLQPDEVTDSQYARAITEQLDWLHSMDEISSTPADILGPDAPE